MKTPLAVLAAIALAFSGCSTTTQNLITPPNARTATALVCTNALLFVKTDGERVATANYIFSVARAVRTLSGGKVPTPDEMKAAIRSFTPDDGKYAVLATNLSSIWGAFYPRVQGNPKIALDYLEAVASGCEDSASGYLLKP